ncbi:hypothetical protein [Serratia marcescens]|uniref:hypothetical protein n=1 Tax=Serratia marcescens TaxID=615 RepID=UPI0034E27B50
MSKKPVLDFTGAVFKKGGERFNAMPDGSTKNHCYTLYITLANGTKFQKSVWYPYNWERWIDQELSPHSPWTSSRGFWRKVSPRQAELLQKAWDENEELVQ